MVRVLVKNGAAVNLENNDNETALHIASIIGKSSQTARIKINLIYHLNNLEIRLVT